MKQLFILFFFLFSLHASAQEEEPVTSAFTVTGLVKNEKVFTLADLKQFKTVTLNDVNTSCSPKKEDIVKEVKAVLLKDILDSVSFRYENRRMLNQYYFLFVAADGYKIVFSFNEIYNTETGRNLYVVTEMDGKNIDQLDNRVLILCTKDIKPGSRNMKWLSKIVVGSAE